MENEIDENVHVVPIHGPAHADNTNCWCEPEITEDFTEDGGVKLVVHRELQ